MTIDEAINKAQVIVEKEKRKLLKVGNTYIRSSVIEEHEKQIEWLEELKELRAKVGGKR